MRPRFGGTEQITSIRANRESPTVPVRCITYRERCRRAGTLGCKSFAHTRIATCVVAATCIGGPEGPVRHPHSREGRQREARTKLTVIRFHSAAETPPAGRSWAQNAETKGTPTTVRANCSRRVERRSSPGHFRFRKARDDSRRSEVGRGTRIRRPLATCSQMYRAKRLRCGVSELAISGNNCTLLSN